MDTNATARSGVNNEPYGLLGERWYSAVDDPVALLRAQARTRNPWICGRLASVRRDGAAATVLDLGCGAGFLANDLARAGHRVVGLDLSNEALAVAARHDETGRVRWLRGDAYELPFPAASFDAVCAMDLLEHVEEPGRIIAEAARVLTQGGLFFFHTFNRTWLSWLIAIKGVEWFVRNTPERLHVLRLFLRPHELQSMCARCGLTVEIVRGLAPRPFSAAFLRMLTTGKVADTFEFAFCRSTLIGYSGMARKVPGR
jgi:2-polyprenyl-6-hydroxyphenyl methylase/3-demethylubiquinone-9 3-methyltransferase